MKKHFIIISMLLLLAVGHGLAQVEVFRSDEIRTINGKEYYIHHVAAGQTLYSISKAYQVPVDEIKYENPELSEGLKAFQVIRIPVRSRDVEVVEKIRQGKFDFIYHIARRGETFNDIALIYAIPEEQLRNANPDIVELPREGQYVRVPVLSTSEDLAASEDFIRHKVEPGETFYSLSKRYNLTVEDIRKANEGLSYPRAGGYVLIPVLPEEERQEKKKELLEYEVKPGETLYGVAKKFQVSIDSIRSHNFGLVDDIYAGQVLRIPYKPGEKEFIVHRVDERKTSLKKLARKYDVEVDELKELNPRLDRRVSFNQPVRIPIEEEAVVPLVMDTEVVEQEPETVEPEKRDEPCMARFAEQETYKVALMLPLYLEEVEHDGGKVLEDPEAAAQYLPFQFLQFYQGFMIAADSLAAEGLKLEVYVYDVDQQISKTIKVLQREELKQMDLIIGPLFRTSFKYVSNFAGLFDIKIVNPLSRSDEIIAGNQTVFKVMPAENEQPEVLGRLIAEEYKNHRVIVVRHNDYQFGEMVSQIRQEAAAAQPPEFSMNNELLGEVISDLSARRTKEGDEFQMMVEAKIEGKRVITDLVQASPTEYTDFPNDTPEIIYMSDSLSGIEKAASVIRPNLVIALADNEVFAIDLMTSLNELKDSLDITLVGVPEWNDFTNLDPEYLMQFHCHLLTADYIDYSRRDIREFVKGFRDKYKAEPGGYAFDGFDVGFYFLSSLMSFGRSFEVCLKYAQPKLLQGGYEFMNIPGGGFENRHWNIYRYGNYRIEKISLPERKESIEEEEL